MIKAKKLIIIIILILVIAAVCLIVILNNRKPKNINSTPLEYLKTFSKIAEPEEDFSNYYTVEDIIKEFNLYVSYLNPNFSSDEMLMLNGSKDEIAESYAKDARKYISDVLASNFKKTYTVDNNYIDSTFKKFAGKKYTITDMYVLHDVESETSFYNWIDTYFIYGNYEGNEFNYVVELDKSNSSFEIYPDEFFKAKGYTKEDVSTMKSLNVENIERNSNNGFTIKYVDKQGLAESYFNDFAVLMKNNPKEAYEKLNSEYKNIRYSSYDKFKNYVDTVVIANKSYELNNYKVNVLENYTEYVCEDNLGRIMVFNVEGVNKYNVLLDTYTVPIQAYEDEYLKASDTRRAQMCLNRFIESLNNNDYETAYNYLNNTYKSNNFPTLEEFTEYVKSNWFIINAFEYSENKSDGSNYIFEGYLFDKETEGSFDAKLVDKTFIVKTGTSIRDFEMSFNK